MANDAEAAAAIEALNGAECGGRSITVNEARPREDRPRGGGGGGGGGRGGFGGGGGVAAVVEAAVSEGATGDAEGVSEP
jgi:RNA recognition motif-containing protein